VDGEGKKKCLAKGTTAYRIVKFVEALVDVLDRHAKREFLLSWIIV
jgi:hypothetical protein